MEKERTFRINQKDVDNLKQNFEDNHLNECITTLDSLIKFSEEKYKVLGKKLLNPSLSEDERNVLLRKIIVAERKFRHMLDVPKLCVKRANDKSYDKEQAIILTTVGILHDIGRVDEILGQDSKTVFKMKVDHASIGAQYLLKDENVINSDDHIYDFVSERLVSKYGYLIQRCVKFHGSLNIPEDKFSTELGKSLIRDIRLIDKSSIMNSFLKEDMSTVIGIPLAELDKTWISDVTYSELTNNQLVNRKQEGEEYTPNRHFMSHVGFIYDMDDYSLLTPNWVTRYLDMYNPVLQKDKNRKEKINEKAVAYMKK